MRYLGARIMVSDRVISGHNHYIDFGEQVPHIVCRYFTAMANHVYLCCTML